VIHVTHVGRHNAELIAKIEAYLDATNNNPKPFVWTATTESILAKIARGRVALEKSINSETDDQLSYRPEASSCWFLGTRAAMELKPRNEKDVAALISIVRPGVKDAGLDKAYLARRSGEVPVEYDHPMMKPITKET